MASADHPQRFSLEIDRDSLRRYLRQKWLCQWIGGIGIFGLIFASIPILNAVEHGRLPSPSTMLSATAALLGFLGFATLCYFIFSHRVAARSASGLEVSVDGSYLHVIDYTPYRVDRKLHFRVLVDYAVIDGPLLRRHGLQILRITTTAIGAGGFINIPGVKNCEAVRDQLAEIDAQRENARAD